MATTKIYTLSLHDALPICAALGVGETPVVEHLKQRVEHVGVRLLDLVEEQDRKSTRLNSSHRCISYAVFCLKKKKIAFRHQNPFAASLKPATSPPIPYSLS